jgi:chromosomal replication initiator protein
LICNYVTSRYADQLKQRLAFYAQVEQLKLSVLPFERGSINAQNQGQNSDSSQQTLDSLADSELGEQRPAQYTPFVVKRVRKTEQQSTTPNPDESQLTSPKNSAADSKTEPLESEVYNNINPRYTFADFVVGNSNQFCHAAAMRVAEKPGQSYNPLFIYGGVGLGKTHLLHAIGNAVLERSPSSRVLYMSSETFTNELILALRYAKMDEFKRKLRTIEVLLIDDIQFISGKERTQEEFFHTFNALYSAKRQIVITSDKIPTDIPGIEERLQTRFSWGLTADLQAPDFETRVAILKQKALLEEFQLPHEVSHLIAERISSNVRELEGALTRLHAMSSIQSVPISLEMAKSALKPLLQPKVVSVTVDDIKKAVANHFNLKVTEIVSKRRTKNLSFPRHIAMYLCRKHTTASYPEIGEHFGGRDHSSVIHAASVVSSKLSTDLAVKEAIENIEKSIFG